MAEQRVGSAPNIRWRDSLEAARAEARGQEKLVLIYLWHHNCGGSATMGERVYPEPEVESYIEDHFAPVRFNTIEEPEMEAALGSGWTPTIITEDPDGNERRRSQGYLDAKRLIGQLALSRLQAAMNSRDFESASGLCEEALRLTQGDPHREPEAMYWSAVIAYKLAGGDRERLIEGWTSLLNRFPESEWAMRASYIRT
ncbi:MAG: thioredoxin family protein [Rubrobacter sp.]|nr:thioredoxin family protein [Rubrobacter sp.]